MLLHPKRRCQVNAVGIFAFGRLTHWYRAVLTLVGGSYGSLLWRYICLCVVSLSALMGRIVMSLCPLVTDIVYAPPPLNFYLGLERWLTYWWPAIRKAESAKRHVLESPGGICMHSGIIALTVSPESRVIIPWNSPIIKVFSVCPEKHLIKAWRHSLRLVQAAV